jgi:AmiR/NasT family two-component response regulator
MKSLSVAILQNDPRVARLLSGQLCHQFQAVHVVRTTAELRDIIVRFRPQVLVVDIETASLSEIEQLHREFTGACIVCTHRIADEEMWTAAMDAGAADICSASDSRAILDAAMRNGSLARSVAA